MPTKTSRTRLARVAQHLANQPVPEHLTKAALARFRATGDLPEDARVGAEVFDRVRSRIDVTRFPNGEVDWGATMMSGFERERRGQDDVMDGLIQEALYAKGLVRDAARQMLVGLASAGMDVTDALFAGQALPEFGSVGLTLMGFPARLARRPYVRQVRRLSRRLERLQKDLPQDRRWFEELGRAIDCFQLYGERPDDDRMLEAVLLLGELNAFMRRVCGEDVEELLALFDKIATTTAEEREPHIRQLQAMAAAGMFRPEHG